ncbi:MAG: cyclic dehypoxanthinyl futalosine synthase [Bacillota bacterium]
MYHAILNRVLAGERLTSAEALTLAQKASLLELGWAADQVRRRLHPQQVLTFVIDRNINYTNVCVTGCKFCAFFRPPGHPDSYVLSRVEIWQKIRETLAQGGTQILMQGGLHPELGLDWFEDLFRAIKQDFPIILHSLSPVEIHYLARRENLPTGDVIKRLAAAGLDSIAGGGAEILVDRVRQHISPHKVSAQQWLAIMAEAHRQGLRSSATMMFGHAETMADRIAHLEALRQVQDETGGFTAFIPWSFQPGNTALGGTPASAQDYLHTLALSRLYLDNIPNLQASWVTQGTKIAQIALAFGANDLGSTMLEENVVRAAGTTYHTTMAEMLAAIRDAGYIPVQRDNLYRTVKVFA